MHGRVKYRDDKISDNFYFCPKKQKQWKQGNLTEKQNWVRGKVGNHGCDNNRAINISLLEKFVCTRVKETLSNSHLLKETFKREILKEKQVGDRDSWEYERHIRVEKTRRSHLERQVGQYRSSLAVIETNILVGDIKDENLIRKCKCKNCKYKLKFLLRQTVNL